MIKNVILYHFHLKRGKEEFIKLLSKLIAESRKLWENLSSKKSFKKGKEKNQ